ncbi:MAG: biopolymer transporter ExbD, partial [Calditrichaeota bacterium]|nr:biopolymer transporter ExbD [Calditrichota bacterium]
MNKNRRKQRYRTNLIIRLIDVVLILLFGFIAISEVSKRSKIRLAESTTVPATVPDRERVLYVGVLPDNRFLVEEETAVIENPAALAAYLAQQRERMEARNIRMKVRVRANHDA